MILLPKFPYQGSWNWLESIPNGETVKLLNDYSVIKESDGEKIIVFSIYYKGERIITSKFEGYYGGLYFLYVNLDCYCNSNFCIHENNSQYTCIAPYGQLVIDKNKNDWTTDVNLFESAKTGEELAQLKSEDYGYYRQVRTNRSNNNISILDKLFLAKPEKMPVIYAKWISNYQDDDEDSFISYLLTNHSFWGRIEEIEIDYKICSYPYFHRQYGNLDGDAALIRLSALTNLNQIEAATKSFERIAKSNLPVNAKRRLALTAAHLAKDCKEVDKERLLKKELFLKLTE